MLKMTRFSKRQLRRTLLLVLLSGLVSVISLLATSFAFLQSSEYAAKMPSPSEQSISSTTPEMVRATNQLAENMRLITNQISNTVNGLINQESLKAEAQFNRTVGDASRAANGLSDAINLTLVENISAALRK